MEISMSDMAGTETGVRRARGGGGATRRAERTAVSFETAKFIQRNIPNFEILNEEALQIIEYNAALNLTVGSEREKFNYLTTLTKIEHQTLTLNFLVKENSTAAAELAATSVLRRKGRVLDAMSDSVGALRRRFDKQDELLLDELNNATTQLVSFVLGGGKNNSADEYRLKLKKLEAERDAVESRVSLRSAGSYEPQKAITLDAVRAVIPLGPRWSNFRLPPDLSKIERVREARAPIRRKSRNEATPFSLSERRET